MRASLVGAFLIAGLVIVVAAGRSSSQQPTVANVETQARPSGELIVHVTPGEGQPNLVMVLDPRQRVLAVYHVDRTSGEITPKSVRNITWDLQMIDFNSGKPLPQDIRSGLQR